MKNITCFLIFLIPVLFYSQMISGKIQDQNKNPISGARIGIENTEYGDLSDSSGNFRIDFSNIDRNLNLKVFVNEFLPFKMKISDFLTSDHNIILSEKIRTIETVTIHPKKFRLKNFGTSNLKTTYCGYDSQKKERLFREYAIKVENKKKLKIKKISVDIVSASFQGTATLIFDIQGSKNGFPDDSKSLSDETLKLTLTENNILNKTVTLDVSDKNIWTNEDFFVLVRVDESLNGQIYFGGNIFAFSKNTYFRNYYGEWRKFSVGEPAINVDVQIEK